jgi:lipopolysaccharide export system protein LptA
MKRLALLALLLAPLPAAAQLIADSDAPIDITGEALEIVGDTATWTGGVRAVQEGAILIADRIVAVLDDDGGFKTIEAQGAVRYSNGAETIAGERALYDSSKRTITVMRDVVLTRGETIMKGGALVYWPDTGRVRFTAPKGERIRGVFHARKAESPV